MEPPPEPQPEPQTPWRRRCRRALETWESQKVWARYNEHLWTDTATPAPPGVPLEYWLVAGLTQTRMFYSFVVLRQGNLVLSRSFPAMLKQV